MRTVMQPSTRTTSAGVLLLILWLVPGIGLAGAPATVPADGGTAVGTVQTDPRHMTFPPVEFKIPEPDRVVFENGLVVLLLEDHELPLVSMTATVRTGGWLDPPDKAGLASLVGTAMRSGGTQRMAPEDLDREVERLAANLTVSIGVESGVATLDLLKKDLDRGLQIFADVLRRPAFDPVRVDLAKLQARESIRRRHDQPQGIASREFAKLVYGPAHPFARESTMASVGRITREDLVAFHATTVHPNGIIIGVTGDFDKAALLASLRQLFGDWPKGPVAPTVIPTPEVGPDRAVRFIAKGTTQTHLRAGHLSLKETDPDYPALVLLNDILGGGSFRSRLFQDIRTKQGLAYSVSSVIRSGVYAPGVWGMRTETKSTSTRQVVATFVANLERLQAQPVTDAELEEAKDAFVNSFIFSFSSPASVLNRRIELEYDGLPPDFLQQLRERVMALTKDDLLRVAQRHLHPDQLKILAVGPPEAAAVLAGFGDVKEIRLDPES